MKSQAEHGASSDEAGASQEAVAEKKSKPKLVPLVTVPAGTEISVYLPDPIDPGRLQYGRDKRTRREAFAPRAIRVQESWGPLDPHLGESSRTTASARSRSPGKKMSLTVPRQTQASPRPIRIAAAFLFLVTAILLLGCGHLKRLAYQGFDRENWQKPDEVIRSLEIQTGDRVADIGAGGGYFTFKLADAVGPTGKVYAADIDSEMIEYLKERASEQDRENIETIQGKPDDPFLPEDGVDLIFLSNTYHHIPDRVTYFTRAGEYLRAEGRVAIIDFKPEGWFHRLFGHATQSETIREEMEAAGYHLRDNFDYLPQQHFLVFSKRTDSGNLQNLPAPDSKP